jgi:hypothetical protein
MERLFAAPCGDSCGLSASPHRTGFGRIELDRDLALLGHLRPLRGLGSRLDWGADWAGARVSTVYMSVTMPVTS